MSSFPPGTTGLSTDPVSGVSTIVVSISVNGTSALGFKVTEAVSPSNACENALTGTPLNMPTSIMAKTIMKNLFDVVLFIIPMFLG